MQARNFLEMPEGMSHVVDPGLKQFETDELQVICEVVSLCIHSNPSKITSMQELCDMLESKIDTTVSSLAWAELALSSN